MLKDTIIVYSIFVDVDQFHPWTTYDVESTVDSIKKAMNWISMNAKNNNIDLSITTVPHFPKGKLSFNESKARPKPLQLNLDLLGSSKKKDRGHIDSWADKIAVYSSKSIKPQKETKLGTKNKVNNIERLIARLRDNYKTDNIALMIFVNGYYENYPSMSLHTYSNGPKTEYSIVTNKNPAVIAHEFLHLFGAIDLYPHSRHPFFNYKELSENYPNEIMIKQHKHINDLIISPITKYYIGWQNKLDKPNTRLLYHFHNVLEY